ncbi:hypothetical protein BaRGS_00022363 [Batillaria attramentaria]|uniref:Di-N-acetylchitobiase n=1 Tax=Batillaria attramentaria TaxID=370345 RepID=A0ABD0KH10_9CAEN
MKICSGFRFVPAGCVIASEIFLLLLLPHENWAHGVPRDSACPCGEASLCEPIKDTTRKEIYVFSLQNKYSSWLKFDWKKVTTVVSVGYVSQELMCLAHEHGARVVTIANYSRSKLTDSNARAQWVAKQLHIVTSNHYDGTNIDFEDVILQNQTDLRAGYTALVRETNQAFKQAQPSYQVTVDVAWSPDCIDLRCYDIQGLAAASDFLFVMAYDEQSQIFGDCIALANSDFNKTSQGLHKYLSLGIKPEQLVLGVPWYGYDYPCVSLLKNDTCTLKHKPFRGVQCSDAAGRQIDYRVTYPLLINGSSGGRKWDQSALSPYFNYKDKSTGQMHQVRYDDPMSLGLKYKMAVELGLRGVGTWNIDCLDYSDASYAVQQRQLMFDAFPSYPRH